MCRRNLLVKGSVITFDEFANYPGWQKGEYLAWTEVVERYQLGFEYISYHAPPAVTSTSLGFKKHKDATIYGYQSVSVVLTKGPR